LGKGNGDYKVNTITGR